MGPDADLYKDCIFTIEGEQDDSYIENTMQADPHEPDASMYQYILPEDKEVDHEDKPGLPAIIIPDDVPEHVAASLGELARFVDAIQVKVQGFKTGWAELDRALNNLQPGFHAIGGDSNIGKSSWIKQLEWQVYENNDDAYVLSISLDDPIKDMLCRTVALSCRVPINFVKNPMAIRDSYPNGFKRVVEGIGKLQQAAVRYRIVDQQAWGSDVEEIAEGIKDLLIKLKSQDKPLRLCVFIDNFHDLTTKVSHNSDKNKYDYTAQFISDLAKELDIPIVCTVEFRKLNNFKRPGLDDIRESVKIKYEAKSVMLCHNEVGVKGEAAVVYYERDDRVEKQPVFEVKFGKNKYTDFKGRIFFNFMPEMAYFMDVDVASARRYAQAIYNNS